MSVSKLPKWKLWLFYLLTAGGVGVVCLLSGEVLVRIFAPQDLSGMWIERSARGGDLNKANWTSRARLGDIRVVYRFNNLHLRGGPIGPGTNRVLCVGDSFTVGWLLDETNSFVYKLNQFAARDFPAGTFEILNGGAGYWGTGDYTAFVEDFGPQIHPSAIVVFLNSDDIKRTVDRGLYRLDPNHAGLVTPLKITFPGRRLVDLMHSFALYQWTLEHSQLSQLLRKMVKNELNLTGRKPPVHSDPESGARLAQALFLRLQHWCLDHDCRLFVVTTGFQAFPDYPLGRAEGAANKRFFEEAPQFFSTNRFAFHDLGPEVFRIAQGDFSRLVIPNDLHPNERGGEAIAASTWQWLQPQLRQMLDTRGQRPESHPAGLTHSAKSS